MMLLQSLLITKDQQFLLYSVSLSSKLVFPSSIPLKLGQTKNDSRLTESPLRLARRIAKHSVRCSVLRIDPMQPSDEDVR